MVEQLLYLLWDSRIQGWPFHAIDQGSDRPGQSRYANEDGDARVAFSGRRRRSCAQNFAKQFRSKCVAGYEREYVEMRMQDQVARHKKFGDSVYMQEPNLKNGCGGLRDYQNLLWMTCFKEGSLTTNHLVGKDWLSRTDQRRIEARLRFSPARAHGPALRDRARHRHSASQHAGTNRRAPELSGIESDNFAAKRSCEIITGTPGTSFG